MDRRSRDVGREHESDLDVGRGAHEEQPATAREVQRTLGGRTSDDVAQVESESNTCVADTSRMSRKGAKDEHGHWE